MPHLHQRKVNLTGALPTNIKVLVKKLRSIAMRIDGKNRAVYRFGQVIKRGLLYVETKQFAHQLITCGSHAFGMPLHTEKRIKRIGLHPLVDPVGRCGIGFKSRSHLLYGLVMQRIHLNLILVVRQDPQQGVGFYSNGVRSESLVVLLTMLDSLRWMLGPDILIHGPSKSHVDKLMPPADPENRYTAVGRQLQQHKIVCIPYRITLLKGRYRFFLPHQRINIPTTGKKQSVQLRNNGRQCIQVGGNRNKYRSTSGIGNRLNIRIIDTGKPLFLISRNPDQRPYVLSPGR